MRRPEGRSSPAALAAKYMKSKRILLTVLLCISAALGLFSFVALRFVIQRIHKFNEWNAALPISMSVDLSQPGNYMCEFEHTCTCSHGCALQIIIPLESITTSHPQDMIDGLDGEYDITDANGTSMLPHPDAGILPSSGRYLDPPRDMPIPINDRVYSYFPKGTYTFSMSITEGASRLAGVDQELQLVYQLCGCEVVPYVIIIGGPGILSLVIAVIIPCVIIVKNKRQRKAANMALHLDAAARRE